MAQTPEDTPRKKSKGASLIVWILVAVLVVGLGGFGVANFSGPMSAMGKVGDRNITLDDYARALKSEIDAFSAQYGQRLTLAQAQMLGLDAQVRAQLANTAALDHESDKIGISSGDARVAQEILSMPAFKGANGQFDRATYRYILDNNNLSEAAFESRLRDDLSRSLLQGAVGSGYQAPAILVDTLYNHIAEKRAFSVLRLNEDSLESAIAAPTEAEVTAFYEANPERFSRPEARRLTWAALFPEALATEMTVSDSEIERLYNERIADFVQPERRLVERLVFADQAAAEAAFARIQDGSARFEDLVSERGLSLNDVDMGDVSEADLAAAGAAIFALTEPGVVGPFDSNLGPALFRMNGILAAQEITLAEVRDDLRKELATQAASRAIDARVDAINDLLAGGATIEDLAKEQGLSTGVLDYYDGVDDPLAGYPAFRKAAAEITESDFAEVIQLGDGGIVVMHLNEILPPAPLPLDEIRDRVAAAWQDQAEAEALRQKAEALQAALAAGQALSDLGTVEANPGVTRSAVIDGLPATLVSDLFAMTEGESRVINGDGYAALVQLDRIEAAPTEGADAEALREAIAIQAEQSIAQDAFMLYVNTLATRNDARFDQAAINAVHAQFQ